jgi:hypothetical protein
MAMLFVCQFLNVFIGVPCIFVTVIIFQILGNRIHTSIIYRLLPMKSECSSKKVSIG